MRSGIFKSSTNNFNIAFLLLVHKGANLNHIDYNGNNILYFAIVSNNRFVLRFLLNNSQFNINNFFFKDEISLSDLLITNKFSSQTKFICKNYTHTLNLKTLNSCLDAKSKFSTMNIMNYELLNLVILYKMNRIFSLLKKVLFEFRYKLYIFNFYIWLVIKNMQSYYKNILFFVAFVFKLYLFIYFNDYAIFNSQYNSIDNIAMMTLDIIIKTYFLSNFLFFIYGYIKLYLINNELPGHYLSKNSLTNQYNVIKLLSDSMSINILNTFFEENICEVCLIKKEKSDNHCDTCNRCVRDFYFHSNFFNKCFNKKNILYYITIFSSLACINIILINSYYESYLRNIEVDKKSEYMISNLIFMVLSMNFIKILLLIYIIVETVYFFQTSFINFLCIGYDVPYYNIFRYHKKTIGVFQQRFKTICNIPQPSVVTFQEFWINVYKTYKNSN